MTKLYLIGSLRNSRIPKLANYIREVYSDVEVFDDWYSAGPEADDKWKEYEQDRGRTYQEALDGYAARHVFEFDKHHLDTSSHVLLVLPAGKSGHMEVMYAAYGTSAKTAILLDPEDVRWDVMYQFIPTILYKVEEIAEWLNTTQPESKPENPEVSLTEVNRRLSKESCITSRELCKQSPKSQSSVLENIYGTDGEPYPTEYDDMLKRQLGMF